VSIDLECPTCGSANHDRYGGPVTRTGRVYRRHTCLTCKRRFLTVQWVVNPKEAEAILDEIERVNMQGVA
jgi:transcriptional regulator NrdR family protein